MTTREGETMNLSEVFARADQTVRSLCARTAEDFAIEFGEYLAVAAEYYMRSVENKEARESGDAWNGLRTAIYEFRKRADRATAERTRRLESEIAALEDV